MSGERALPARGIYGWDSSNNVWVKILVDSEGKIQITNSDLITILSEIQDEEYGLSALRDLADASILLLGGLGDDLEALGGDLDRKIQHMDFWADNTPSITLTTTSTDDHALSSLTVAGIPNGATVVRVVAFLKIAAFRDTSASNNAINGATALKVDADVAYGSLVTAIDIPDESWAVVVNNSVDRGGDVLIGDNDVKTEIVGNGTYYARLENMACDGNNLLLLDVAWGIRIYFY